MAHRQARPIYVFFVRARACDLYSGALSSPEFTGFIFFFNFLNYTHFLLWSKKSDLTFLIARKLLRSLTKIIKIFYPDNFVNLPQ